MNKEMKAIGFTKYLQINDPEGLFEFMENMPEP